MDLSPAILCLALNIYHESRGEPSAGQYAVAHVTLNRAHKNNTSICKEVYRKHQFSWTQTKYQIPHKDDAAWKQALQVAKSAQSKPDPTRGSTYFFNPRMCTNTKTIVTGRVMSTKIGSHVFYADKAKYQDQR